METNVTLQEIAQQLKALQEQMSAVQEKLDKMTGKYATPIFATEHPYIVRVPRVQGGHPIIKDTGRTVRGVVELSRQMTLEELLKEYEGSLTPAQLFDALSYYYDHPGEIDQYIMENNAGLERIPDIKYPTDHPHVFKNPRIHRGEPIIQGTRVTVRNIIEQTNMGLSPQEIVQQNSELEIAQVYDALAYYYDHTEEVEQYRSNMDKREWQSHHVSL